MTAAATDPGGLVGFALWLISAMGEWGVGAFTVLETVFPPIPSEIVLPLAGYQARLGELSLPLLFATSTAGSYVGALFLYGLGRAFGLERSIRGLARLPLVEREDFERAAAWFTRHGKKAVFFGRLVPGVRSLVSLPAGASRMNLLVFSLFTLAGSGSWNSLLIALGAALSTQYELVGRYSSVLNYVVYAAIAGVVTLLFVRWVRRRRATSRQLDQSSSNRS